MKKVKSEKRPPCPECGSKDIKSSAPYWICNVCGRHFKKKPRGVFRLKIERPDCPFCGASDKDILSKGVQWGCKACRRCWLKHPIGTKRKVEGERPSCPHCHSPDPMSKGNRWICVVCNRSWNKIYQRLEFYTPLDLHNAKIIEI